MTPYQTLYDYSLQLTGNKRQSRAIVNYVILEGARILVETGDAENTAAYMMTKVSTLSYDYTRRRDKRWYRRVWERAKAFVR